MDYFMILMIIVVLAAIYLYFKGKMYLRETYAEQTEEEVEENYQDVEEDEDDM
jgi:hypothetical protein